MTQTSNSTAIGIFDDYRTAERVTQNLAKAGIPRQSIHLHSNFMTGAAGQTDRLGEQHESGLSGFFHRLFSEADYEREYSGHYAEAVRRGSAVVSVTAPSDQIEMAVQMMNAEGAIDIDRRVAAFRRSGYERYNPNAPAYSSEEAARELEEYHKMESGASILVAEEEELQSGRRLMRRGGVHVHCRNDETNY
jgi:hypothetical protein